MRSSYKAGEVFLEAFVKERQKAEWGMGDGVGADATPLEGTWTPGAAGAEAPQMRAPPPPQKQMEQWGL